MYPLVSAVIPVFNGLMAGPGFLTESLESLINQDYEGPIEILLVDDGSTDKTVDVARDLSSRITKLSRKLEVLTRPHTGVTRTLNEGCKAASGSLIARQDADDFSEPDRISKQVAYLQQHPEVAVVASAVRVVHGTQRKDEVWYRSATEKIATHAFREGSPVAHGSTMIRADVLRHVGYYNERFPHAQDYDLFWRIKRQHEIASLPEPLYNYRVHGNRVTNKKFRVQADCAREIRQRINREMRVR